MYDMPLQSLNFEFEKNKITLNLLDLNLSGGYTTLQLIFQRVFKFSFQYPDEKFNFQPIAVVKAELKKNEDFSFQLTLLIDMPKKELQFGREDIVTAGEMCIGFKDLEVIGGLNREQMLQKWREED
jgi:hypothetical protein